MRTTLTDGLEKNNITITKTGDGAKNTIFVVSGTVLDERDLTYFLIGVDGLQGNPKSLRLDNAAFLVESGLKCIISYKGEPYFLPFEGKGKLELDPFGGLPGHDLSLTVKGTGTFLIVLDISKLGV
jgi:hypothetical protein